MIPRTIDPLQFLRENYQQKNIKRNGDNLEFEGGIRLPLDAPTALINRQNKTQYTIGELYFFIKNISKPLVNYFEETQKEKINVIPSIDKECIQDYFRGNNNVDNLDNELKTKTLIFMGKKMNDNDLKQSLKETNNSNLEHQSKKEFLKKKRLLELKNPSLAIMDYIYTNEKKSLNRNSMLKPPVNVQSYESLLSFCRKVFQKDGEGIKSTEKLSFLDELSLHDGLNDKPKGIIIVPSTYCEGNLCFENAKTFLEEAKYINMKSEEDLGGLIDDPKKNVFVHKIMDKEVSFEIHSNIRNFKRNDWKKVVAVFLNGEEWEFKDWPKGEDVISILQKVKGFHLKYKGLPINQNIKNWNVKVLEIHRTQRHYDITIQTNFWQIIEEFLKMPRIR